MRSYSILVAALSALAISLPAAAQDAPSNAELFRMLKAQQKTLAKQEALIGKLRTELGRSHAALKRTRHKVELDGRQVRKLTARVTQGQDAKVTGADAFAAAPKPSSLSIEGSYLYLKPSLNDTYFASVGTTSGSASGTLYPNDSTFKSAWRIGATYTNGFDGRKLMAFYTVLNGSTSRYIYPAVNCGRRAEARTCWRILRTIPAPRSPPSI